MADNRRSPGWEKSESVRLTVFGQGFGCAAFISGYIGSSLQLLKSKATVNRFFLFARLERSLLLMASGGSVYFAAARMGLLLPFKRQGIAPSGCRKAPRLFRNPNASPDSNGPEPSALYGHDASGKGARSSICARPMLSARDYHRFFPTLPERVTKSRRRNYTSLSLPETQAALIAGSNGASPQVPPRINSSGFFDNFPLRKKDVRHPLHRKIEDSACVQPCCG